MEMMDKINSILSDEESMKQLKELADMFMGDNATNTENTENTDDTAGSTSTENAESANNDENGENSGGGFDFAMIFKIMELMNKTNEDDNTKLLLALKPFLSEERQKKTDKAVKMLKMLAIYNVLKESGMLNNIF
jgi:hypothetical protein